MKWSAILTIVILGSASAQLTAQTSVAPELRECYLNTTLINRNNLPPASIAVLIDIIQKIEDNPNINIALRQMAVLLLHTYRQDGIEYHHPDATLAQSVNVLPYAPTFHSFYRHKLLLTKLIPSSNYQVFGNDTVNSVLKCSLHHMLSTTVDARLRGDEAVCNQLSQYRTLRVARDVSSVDDDVEIMDKTMLDSANKVGHMRRYNPKDDVEFNGNNNVMSERQVLGDSQCPILNGVVNTKWGTVSAGNLIAGIAAGAEPQQVLISEITKGSVLNSEYANVQQYVTTIFPATLAGDLAEAALIQGTETGATTVTIGSSGGWNSTQARKFYMLRSRVNVEMTDAEIRGGIDGFFLGTVVPTALNTYSGLKLSQLLDMYYSDRNGLLNTQYRACNRNTLSTQVIDAERLATETLAFAAALDTNLPLRGTLTSGVQSLVVNAVTSFQSYASNNLNDLNCVTTETTAADYRLRTNLYIVLDSSWQYEVIYPAISYIVDHIEVGKFGSSVTLLSAFDGSLIVNKTFSPADFHSEYTVTKHQSMLMGVNLETAYSNIRTHMAEELDNEKSHNYVGGNATVLLFLLNTGNLQNNEQVWEHARAINDTVPDLRVLYATSTNQQSNLWNLVRDMNNDILTVSLTANGLNVDTALNQLLTRIQTVGRRVVNSNCGSTWDSSATSGTRQFDDFLEPGYINFYSISPNYFYHNSDNRKIRITRSTTGIGSLVICHSRSVPQPRQNGSINLGVDTSAITCQTLAATGNIEIPLLNLCDGYWTINTCPHFYLSVESTADTTTTLTNAMCTDTHACRFPYNIRYQVQIEEFGCYSSSWTIKGNFLVLISSTFYLSYSWM